MSIVAALGPESKSFEVCAAHSLNRTHSVDIQ
jgi:hypothetical protein